MDEVEYQKRRSQKITGYAWDRFVILHPPEKQTLSWEWGCRQLTNGMLTVPLRGSCFLNLGVNGTNQQHPTNIFHKNHHKTLSVTVFTSSAFC